MNTIEEFKNKITKKSRLLGLDLGSKRIGIAICDDHQSIATPFKTIIKEDAVKLINELKFIIKENNIEGIIVGNPINMDGSLGPASQSAKDACINIKKNINTSFKNNQKRKNHFENLEILDLGCGGGLVCEPLSRLKAKVTGIDFVKKNIKIAKQHAKKSNLKINYIKQDLSSLNLNIKIINKNILLFIYFFKNKIFNLYKIFIFISNYIL